VYKNTDLPPFLSYAFLDGMGQLSTVWCKIPPQFHFKFAAPLLLPDDSHPMPLSIEFTAE
jgi:hypothetical protein